MESVRAYRPYDGTERAFLPQFLALLEQPTCFLRHHLVPGHVTASAWIINSERTHTLLLFHRKLQRWLQPGGHADGNENVAEVARKEAEEETGLRHFLFPSTHFFDLDIHTIPARNAEPAHQHFDFRFLVIADRALPLYPNAESAGLQWVELNRLAEWGADPSLERLRAKTG